MRSMALKSIGIVGCGAIGRALINAAAVVPLALVTLSRALRERFDAHRRIARWTFPIWLYVSVTGVIVYAMLYRF